MKLISSNDITLFMLRSATRSSAEGLKTASLKTTGINFYLALTAKKIDELCGGMSK